MRISASPRSSRSAVTMSLALTFLALTGCASTVLVPVPASHDFGEVYIGQTATSPTVVWRNIGTNQEGIDGLETTPAGGPFTRLGAAGPFTAFVLPAGATTPPFGFIFRPTSEGPITGGATPQTLGTPGGTYQDFAMVGIGRAQITRGVLGIGGGDLTPAQALDFGRVAFPGGTRGRLVTVINAGASAITVNAAITPATGQGFSVALPPLPFTVPARGQTTVTLVFIPPAIGTFNAVVDFFDTAGVAVNRAGTILSGEGVAGG